MLLLPTSKVWAMAGAMAAALMLAARRAGVAIAAELFVNL